MEVSRAYVHVDESPMLTPTPLSHPPVHHHVAAQVGFESKR